MSIEELKKIKGNVDAFLNEKKGTGLPSYTFTEATQYLGYDRAKKIASAYLKSVYDKFSNCTLTRTYLDLHFDCYKVLIKDPVGYEIELIVEPNGLIAQTEVHYRDFEVKCKVLHPCVVIKTRKAVKDDEVSTLRSQAKLSLDD